MDLRGTVVSMKVAGIDCGTNSLRLLVAQAVPRAGGNGLRLRETVRRMEVVRLGAGVDRTGKFNGEALARTLRTVSHYARICEGEGVESIRFAATSATRDAENRQCFIDGVKERLGVCPQVLSGKQEAEMSFAGAVSTLDTQMFRSELLAVDLGGGSTELALGTPEGRLLESFSMNVGCVRMHERHLHADPPTEEEIAAARRDVRLALDEAEKYVDLSRGRSVLGLAGTVTTVTARALGLKSYDPQKIHGTFLTVPRIDEVCNWFIGSNASMRAAEGYLHPGRADVIASGALVWQEIVRRIDLRIKEKGGKLGGVFTSEHDILDGLALWAAREPNPPCL